MQHRNHFAAQVTVSYTWVQPLRATLLSVAVLTCPSAEELINKNKPLWLRPAEEVTHEEYAELYKFLSADWEDWVAMIPLGLMCNVQMLDA